MDAPQFSLEPDKVGLGWCVIATWPDGLRVVIPGFGNEEQARRWIEVDSATWLTGRPEN